MAFATLVPTLCLSLNGLIQNEIQVEARLAADELVAGNSYAIELSINLGESTAEVSGISGFILQLDVPEAIQLEGRHLQTYRELARNEFLEEPYERLLKETEARIPFKYVGSQEDRPALGLNLVGYLSSSDGERDVFLRRRLELPVVPRARSVAGSGQNSRWGTNKQLLQIGDSAPSFILPALGGESLDLSQYLGKKNVLVTTYRAFW